MLRIRQRADKVGRNKAVFFTTFLLTLIFASFSYSIVDDNSPPVVSRVSPVVVMAGSPDLMLTIGGRAFTELSTVHIDNLALNTTFSSATELTALLPAGLLVASGVLDLSVFQPELETHATAPSPLTIIAPGAVLPTKHPQVAAYDISVPREAQVTVAFEALGQPVRRTWSRPTPPSGGEVRILVAGMLAFTTYTLRAIVEFPDGTTFIDADKAFTTGGLSPDRIPTISVTASDVLSPNPGVQLLDLIRLSDNIAVVTNLDGNIIWFHETFLQLPLTIRYLPSGNFLINNSTRGGSESILQEIDLAGNVLREIVASEINNKLVARGLEPVAGFFHHDAIVLPNGHLMLLAAFNKTFTDLIGFEGQAVEMVGDSLIQLDENLDPVWTWSSFDHLDVNRYPFSDPEPPNPFDWTHGNAVVYSAADNTLLVSLRHQDWVLKIDYQDGLGNGGVLWRLGFEGDFDLLDAGSEGWPYAQHDPFIIEDQVGVLRLAIWDNGNFRVVDDLTGATCDPDVLGSCYSRAVIYDIDQTSSTVRTVWEDKLDFLAPFLGSIRVFDDGHVLWNAGSINGQSEAIVREVTQDVPPQWVWQADVSDYFVYRSFRLPSLYPGVQW